MSDTANIVGKVTADTSQAVKSVGELKRAADAAGAGFAGMSKQATAALDSVVTGLGKFNLALGGIQKALNLVGEAAALVKFSAEMRNASERMIALGTSADDLSRAVGGTVDDMTLMRFAMAQLQGETRLTREQLVLVLKAADNLGDKLGKDTMKVAEDLAVALKGGPVRALREYNIEIDESAKGTERINGLLKQLKTIAAEKVPIDAQLDAIEQVEAGWKNLVNNVKDYIAKVLVDIYKMFDDLSNALAGLGSDGTAVTSTIGFAMFRGGPTAASKISKAAADYDARQKQLEQWRAEESAVLPTSINASPAKSASKKSSRKRGGGGSRTPGDIDVDGMLAGAWEAEDFYDADVESPEITEARALIAAMSESLVGMSEATERAMDVYQATAEEIASQENALKFDVFAQAVNQTANAFWNLGHAILSGTGSASEFLKELARAAEGIGKDAALKALYALGEAWFTTNPKTRAEKLLAAKFYGLTAAASVGTAAALSGLAGSGGGSGGGGSGPSSQSAGGFGGSTITGSGGGGPVVINVQGNLYGEPAAFGRAVADGLDAAQRSGRTRLRSNRYH